MWPILIQTTTQSFLLPGSHVGHEVYRFVAIATFIVIPGNLLDKVVKSNATTLSIKGERVGVAAKVAIDKITWSLG